MDSDGAWTISPNQSSDYTISAIYDPATAEYTLKIDSNSAVTSGGIQFGSGTAANDTQIYRASDATLKSDDRWTFSSDSTFRIAPILDVDLMGDVCEEVCRRMDRGANRERAIDKAFEALRVNEDQENLIRLEMGWPGGRLPLTYTNQPLTYGPSKKTFR